jgi:hypothetical protein
MPGSHDTMTVQQNGQKDLTMRAAETPKALGGTKAEGSRWHKPGPSDPVTLEAEHG